MVLKRHYPNFTDLLNSIPDHRKRSTYQVSELVMAGLSMFIFKRGSRHNADLSVRGDFENNYITLFGVRLPVMDTVDEFLRRLPTQELERIKKILITQLIAKRFFDKHRFRTLHPVAIDGTGLMCFDHEPFEGCPYKTSKNGVKTWNAYVLEAKLVCLNGLSLSIGTEWYVNSQDIGAKQDCELKAFIRLAEKIKKDFPRLPILLLADSLYPNKTVFETCKSYNWSYIFTFKDGTLKSVWTQVDQSIPEQQKRPVVKNRAAGLQYESISYLDQIDYHNHQLNWLEYRKYNEDQEAFERFVHISSILVNQENCWQISQYGRLRWKIENQGFNTQKNQGYGLQHKYSRKNLGAMQNYYQLLQIAHFINQLTEKLLKVKAAIEDSKTTIKSLWEDIIGSMKNMKIESNDIVILFEQTRQLRY